MTLESMKNLVTVYDAVDTLWDLYCKVGESRITTRPTIQENLLEQLLKVADVINRESGLYEPGAD